MKKNLMALLALLLCLMLCVTSFVSCDIEELLGGGNSRDEDEDEEVEKDEDEESTKKKPGGFFWPEDEETDESDKYGSDTDKFETMRPDDTTDHPHEHNFDKWEISKDPTCTKEGQKVYYCECGAYEFRSVPANGHNYRKDDTIEPTCQNEGYTVFSCQCGESYIETYAPKGEHKAGDWMTEESYSPSFCYKYTVCIYCGEYFQKIIEPSDALYDQSKLAVEDIGAKNAGSVIYGYQPVSTVGIYSLAEITDPYGSYYLKGNIRNNEHTVPEFYGILDGCGYEIKTSVPLFNVLGGGVLNLNLGGTIDGMVESGGALANTMISNTAVVNVKNECELYTKAETSQTDIYVGGFAAYLCGENVTFLNCEFSGTIVNEYDVKANNRYTGGFVAVINEVPEPNVDTPQVDFLSCTVSGAVRGTSHAGGLFGHAVSPVTVYVAGCLNIGDVVNGTEGSAGGLLGHIDGPESCTVDIFNCINAGVVLSAMDAGGIIGANVTKGAVSMLSATWCYNYGEIIASRYVGGIVGRQRQSGVFVECVNYMDITVELATGENGEPDPKAYRNYVGGIVGLEESSSGAIPTEYSNCINYGNLTAFANNVRLGGIAGHHERIPAIFTNCVNFGNLTSAYVASDSSDGDGRFGGITGGGNSNFELYSCVNFGDIKHEMGKWAVPSGGIIGYVTNSGLFCMSSCINYGDIDVSVLPLWGTDGYRNTTAAGLAGLVTGVNGITVVGCINAGTLTSDRAVANFVNWQKSGGFIESDMDIRNNYYVFQNVQEGVVYGNFLYNDMRDEESQIYLIYEAEERGMAITIDEIRDNSVRGIAAYLNKMFGAKAYACTSIWINGKGVENYVIPVEIVELIEEYPY